MEYQIKELSRAMLPDLLELERTCFAIPWTEGMFLGELENEAAVYRVVLSEGRPVAYMGMWCVADEGQITNIAVHPAHRRKSLAVNLIETFIALAEEKSLKLLTLEVREHNLPAVSLYRKMGFRQVGRRKNYYEGKEDALLMTLFLENLAAEGEK